ncbi:hypothetical protein LCGC14_1511440, partial [marine sediment metagenome]
MVPRDTQREKIKIYTTWYQIDLMLILRGTLKKKIQYFWICFCIGVKGGTQDFNPSLT